MKREKTDGLRQQGKRERLLKKAVSVAVVSLAVLDRLVQTVALLLGNCVHRHLCERNSRKQSQVAVADRRPSGKGEGSGGRRTVLHRHADVPLGADVVGLVVAAGGKRTKVRKRQPGCV